MINRKKKATKTVSELVATPEADDLFGIANISPKDTGLPFWVWIRPQMGVRYDVRVWVSRGLKIHFSELVSVAVRPDVRVVGGELTDHDLTVLQKWVALNRDVLVRVLGRRY